MTDMAYDGLPAREVTRPRHRGAMADLSHAALRCRRRDVRQV